jgi:hypothetical protein
MAGALNCPHLSQRLGEPQTGRQRLGRSLGILQCSSDSLTHAPRANARTSSGGKAKRRRANPAQAGCLTFRTFENGTPSLPNLRSFLQSQKGYPIHFTSHVHLQCSWNSNCTKRGEGYRASHLQPFSEPASSFQHPSTRAVVRRPILPVNPPEKLMLRRQCARCVVAVLDPQHSPQRCRR